MAQVAEKFQGNQVSRSSNDGQLADTATRVFRIVLDSLSEVFDIQLTCGVKIGDKHPVNENQFCTAFDARYEGDSRLVFICTFQYQSTASAASSTSGSSLQDPRSFAPNVRPANWTIKSSLYEIPIWSWRERTAALEWGQPESATNPANDFYDGVSALDAIVTVSIEQYESLDPTKHARHVGAVNRETITLGSLVMPPHTVMLRGIDCRPTVESWGLSFFRGWTCSYEFAYRANDTSVWIGTDTDGGRQTIELGWDVAIPQTGFNVKCFAVPGRGIDDPYGQPLKFDDNTKQIKEPLTLSGSLSAGEKARAQVRVPMGDKSSQSPSAQPIALNDNGRPRKDSLTPIVRGYQVHRDVDFTQTFGLRLS